jgi:hypothetical protein
MGRKTAIGVAVAAVAAAATIFGLQARSGSSSSPLGSIGSCPRPEKETATANQDGFDTALEQLVQDQADALGDRFGGASWEPDGTVTFRLTGDGKVPQALRDNPKIRVVKIRFSADRLEAVMDTVASRLNALLAPGGTPIASGAWPWAGQVDVERNVVAVQVDPSQRARDAAIRAALADERATGTVWVCYEPIPVVVDL